MEQKTKCSLLGEVVSAMSIFSRMQNQHQGKDPEKMFVAFPLENLHLLSGSLYYTFTTDLCKWSLVEKPLELGTMFKLELT